MKEKLRRYTMNSLKFYNLKILDGALNSNCYVFVITFKLSLTTLTFDILRIPRARKIQVSFDS